MFSKFLYVFLSLRNSTGNTNLLQVHLHPCMTFDIKNSLFPILQKENNSASFSESFQLAEKYITCKYRVPSVILWEIFFLYFSNNEIHWSTKALLSYNVLNSLIYSAQKLPGTHHWLTIPYQLSVNLLVTRRQLTVNSRSWITVEKKENS